MRSVIGKLLFSVGFALLWVAPAEAEKRVWTSKSGHQVIATMEDRTEDVVSLRVANRRQPVVVSIQDLSEKDQQFLKEAVVEEEQVNRTKVFISKPGDHALRMQNPLFVSYAERLDERRAIALESRRIYNANKGPAVYYMGNIPDPMFPMGIAIEKGWVQQPPIVYPWYGRPWWHRPRIILDDDPFVHSFSD